MSRLRLHSTAGRNLNVSGTETRGSQHLSRQEVASAPPCVSPTPTFGLASISVLCAGQEGAGRWCWTVVAVPLSHAPWLVRVEDGITGRKTAAAAPLSPRHTKKRPGAPHNHRAWGFAGSPGVTFRSSSHCERVISCNRVHGQGAGVRARGGQVAMYPFLC